MNKNFAYYHYTISYKFILNYKFNNLFINLSLLVYINFLLAYIIITIIDMCYEAQIFDTTQIQRHEKILNFKICYDKDRN
jgi:hypothetical protein